ncbi:MAG: sigma factor-like helix-turn-helix DNA-binding protein, partial [Candidatus Thorarchaeota archaeon]|jgi:DNA-binding transcriptional regulator LsrR (DeoR family)
VSDEIEKVVESAESELEEIESQEDGESSENEVTKDEVIEEEEVLEDLEDFVKQVQDMLDEYLDDDYDYVQDPLTGEMQQVYRILSEYESEEQRLRRKLRNIFGKLSEEEREQFKEIVRKKVVSEDKSFAEQVESLWTSVVEKAEEARIEAFESSNELTGPLEEVVRLRLLENMSEREIAKRTGLSRNQVRKALRDAEIHHRYYSEGQTFQEIASDLDLTIKILRGVFRKHGWEMRIQRERKRLSVAEIRRLHHEEGMTFFQIAEYSGLDMPTIRKVIGPKDSKTLSEEIGRLYFQEGYSFEMVCDILGVSIKTVRRTFEKNNWSYQRSRSSRKQLDPDWVYHLYYNEGFSHNEVAELLSVTPATIQKFFIDQGWPSRDTRQRREVDIDEQRRNYQRNRRRKLKETRVEMFGNKCYACHTENQSKKSLHLHRKDGTEHDRNLFRSLKKLKSLKPEEWAPLCDRCHLGAHLLMNVCGYDWAKIEAFLESRSKESVKPKGVLDLPEENAPLSKQAKKIDPDLTKKELRKALFGETCSLCNCDSEDTPMILHRKDGQTHDPAMIDRKKHLQKLNPDEWALVCHNCHNIAQWALDKLGIEWSKLTKRLKQK